MIDRLTEPELDRRLAVELVTAEEEDMALIKLLGLLAIAAGSCMTIANTASATTLTGPGGNSTPAFHFLSEEDKEVAPGTKHVDFHNNIATVLCNSTAAGAVEQHGPGIKATGQLTSLVFGTAPTEGCTSGWVVHVVSAGDFRFESTGGNKATVYSSGLTLTFTRLGLECRLRTNTTHIGTLTGGNPATLRVRGLIPLHGGSGLCGGPAGLWWTGSYVTTEELNIDE
ncbi:MAG TPA: hypothetical protein VFS54_02715 [Solirubrobacterales bacterium]|nr:hypothetical protein [Solirubrobacterales bacterium]